MNVLVRTTTAAMALLGPCACVDTSAVDYHPPAVTGPDGGTRVTDGGDGGQDLNRACRDCMTSGVCQSATEGCRADSKCSVFLECALDSYCLNFSTTDLANLPPCLVSCAAASGIAGQHDPTIEFVAPVILCAQDPARCDPVCNVK